MRIAVVSPFVDKRHGTERAVAELLERLARDYGCEIHLYAQRVAGLWLATPESKHPEGSGRIVWHRVPGVPGPHLLQYLAWLIFNGAVRRWDTFRSRSPYAIVFSPGINCLHPDIVVVHALFHRLRELALERGDDSAARGGILRRCHRRLYYLLLTRLERRIYTRPRVTLAAVSKRTAGLLKTYFERDDVAVIPNGVDRSQFSREARLSQRSTARRQRHIQGGDCVLLLIGNDWSVKGLPVILRAMASLRDLPLRLLVVGTDAAGPFQEYAAELGILERCLWERPTPNALDLYAAADIYVSPSREDSFGLPVAEAMACGILVITSTQAGVAECIREGVDGLVLSDPTDSTRLAGLIRKLYERKDAPPLPEAEAADHRLWTWAQNADAFFRLLQSASLRHWKAKSQSEP